MESGITRFPHPKNLNYHSDCTVYFVTVSYSTKMRGGCLRFQAQYLRRIRLPKWGTIPPDAQQILSHRGGNVAPNAIQQAVLMTYGLTKQELTHLTD